MPKYIDAEVVKLAIVDAVDKGLATHAEDLAEIIDDLPDADVELVRHGIWIFNKKRHSRCSICGVQRDIHFQIFGNYCPNCGTKMDLEEDEANNVGKPT